MKSCRPLALLLLAAMPLAQAVEVTPEGRLHLDYGDYRADQEAGEDRLHVRRAALGIEVKFGGGWELEAGYDFADGDRLSVSDGEFKDVSLEYEGWDAGQITLGQFKMPFGMEEGTSSNSISLIERSLPVDLFAPGRRMGAAFSRQRPGYTLSVAAFGANIDGGGGRGVAARLTTAPIHSDRQVLHLGTYFSSEDPQTAVDLDAAPEARPPRVKLVDTGDIDGVDRIRQWGVEAAWQAGPVLLSSEWIHSRLRRRNGLADASLSGWYLAGSWFLTGQVRRYDEGGFKAVSDIGEHGAWELTARYSRLDLDDGPVQGGRERNATVGVNYYYNKRIRVMANYIKVDSERRGEQDNPNIALVRLQLAF